jgi:hypothetical protein
MGHHVRRQRTAHPQRILIAMYTGRTTLRHETRLWFLHFARKKMSLTITVAVTIAVVVTKLENPEVAYNTPTA